MPRVVRPTAFATDLEPSHSWSVAIQAITSGRVVPSNWWRATEVVTEVESLGIPESAELREAYEAHRL